MPIRLFINNVLTFFFIAYVCFLWCKTLLTWNNTNFHRINVKVYSHCCLDSKFSFQKNPKGRQGFCKIDYVRFSHASDCKPPCLGVQWVKLLWIYEYKSTFCKNGGEDLKSDTSVWDVFTLTLHAWRLSQ